MLETQKEITTSSNIPAPTPPLLSGAKPVVGHLLEFRKDRTALLTRGYEEHGKLFAIKLGPQNVAVLIGPEYQKTFFMETDKTLDIAKPYQFLRAMFGDVAFVSSHETYLRQRPVLHEPFKRDKMAQYVEIMYEEIQKWLDSLDDEGQLELTGAINILVQNVAGHALMGRDFQEQVGREFWDLYEDMAKALDPVLPPDWPLPKFRRRDRAREKMRTILAPIIAERRQNPEQYNDFLQDLITKPGKDGQLLSEEEITGLLLALMFAGHETTAGQGAWAIILLLQHPDYLALVQEEIDEKMPLGSDLPAHKYLQSQHLGWAVTETERLRPSADMQMRTVIEDIEMGGTCIPAGWQVQTAVEVAHRLPELFEESDTYDPLRYAPDREEDRQDRFAMIGFGGGMHKCTGMNFANTEMTMIAALLFQQFDVKLLTPNPEIETGLGANRPSETWIRYQRRVEKGVGE